ncbi:protein translocase subunit SecD [Patescibacteria group bacterium]|nr:protein translocase subunit SecD [Patescibacteria group bacterium]
MKRSRTWPILTIVIAVLVIITALPQNKRQFVPSFLQIAKLHYGLDLVGGTQLDFRISEREMLEQVESLKQQIEDMENQDASADKIAGLRSQMLAIEDQQRGIVEAIRTVLERRINALGVSEAVITPSYIGDEKHLLVECPGVVDTQACINTVGKTIKLEFKEEFTEATEEYDSEVRKSADNVIDRIKAGETLAVVGEDMSDELGTGFENERAYFYDELNSGLEKLWEMDATSGVQKIEGSLSIPERDDEGRVTIKEIPGIFISEVIKPRELKGRVIINPTLALEHLANIEEGATYQALENVSITEEGVVQNALLEMSIGDIQPVAADENEAQILFLKSRTEGSEVMEASHILIAFEGALSADESVTRTASEALALTKELKTRIDGGESFADLAREYSDGPSNVEGGSLGEFGRGTMVPAFEAVSFDLSEGEVSDPTETQFGYHLIMSNRAPEKKPDLVTYDALTISGEGAFERADALATDVETNKIEREEDALTIRSLFFSLLPTGWKDTTLDGKHFRSATVTLDPTTNIPVVQITFDSEGGELFHELTKNNVGKRIAIFVGGNLVSAPTVQTEIAGGVAVITGSQNFEEAKNLAVDLNTGAIPAPIYLSGQRTVEATLGAQALQKSVKAALIGIAILMFFMILIYRLLGLIADLALCVYAVIFLALLKVPLFLFSGQFIVLTLAGMAGIILSIGMAVDANILIFERIKEELRKGKLFTTAVDTGFQKAWPSIRDGNVSTFITCVVLFLIGTSIVRGFAATLGMGVLISMFSAIVVTKWLLNRIAKSPLAENTELFGVKNPKEEIPEASSSEQ